RARTLAHERFRQSRHRVEDVFAIVENKEQPPYPDGLSDGLRGNFVATQFEAERPCNRGGNQVGIRQGDQLDPPSLTFEGWEKAVCKLQRQLGLSDASGPGQGDDAIGREKVSQMPQGGGSAYQLGRRRGQIARDWLGEL